MKNPALPFYCSNIDNELNNKIKVKYNTNSFYIFCKNFEVIAAEVFKFEKIKTTCVKSSGIQTLCGSIALNVFNAGYRFEDVTKHLKEKFNINVTIENNIEISEEENEALALASALAKITPQQLSYILVKFSPLFGKCSTESIKLVATYVNAALVEFEASNFCNIFFVYEYLLNNHNIFIDVLKEIENVCKDFIGMTVEYNEDTFNALAKINKLCINSISIASNEKITGISDVEKESATLYFKLGTANYDENEITEFINYLCEQQNSSWENWEKMLMLTFRQNNLFRKIFNYNYVADFVLANSTYVSANNDLINGEALAKVKFLFSKEEEVVQFLMDINDDVNDDANADNHENCYKTLVTMSLDDVLERKFRSMCDVAYNNFSKKAYSDF